MKYVPMTATTDSHTARTAIPVRRYNGDGVWIDCSDCEQIHWATQESKNA